MVEEPDQALGTLASDDPNGTTHACLPFLKIMLSKMCVKRTFYRVLVPLPPPPSPTICLVLESNQISMRIPKPLEGADLSWKLNCVVWASVDQLDQKKTFTKLDRDVMRELPFQVIVH